MGTHPRKIKLLGHYMYWSKFADGSSGWSPPGQVTADIERFVDNEKLPPLVKTLNGFVAQRWQSPNGEVEWRDRNDQVIAILVP